MRQANGIEAAALQDREVATAARPRQRSHAGADHAWPTMPRGWLCWLEEQIADMTTKGARELDIGPVTTAVNSLRRVLETLGVERKAKDVTPTLSEYIERHPTIIDATETKQ